MRKRPTKGWINVRRASIGTVLLALLMLFAAGSSRQEEQEPTLSDSGTSTPRSPCSEPPNRSTDCGDGTVSDNETGLLWLKSANCFGESDWESAKAKAAALSTGNCGLRDGSSPGDWRLPTVEEWRQTLVWARGTGCTYRSLSDDAGNPCLSDSTSSFDGIESTY